LLQACVVEGVTQAKHTPQLSLLRESENEFVLERLAYGVLLQTPLFCLIGAKPALARKGGESRTRLTARLEKRRLAAGESPLLSGVILQRGEYLWGKMVEEQALDQRLTSPHTNLVEDV